MCMCTHGPYVCWQLCRVGVTGGVGAGNETQVPLEEQPSFQLLSYLSSREIFSFQTMSFCCQQFELSGKNTRVSLCLGWFQLGSWV